MKNITKYIVAAIAAAGLTFSAMKLPSRLESEISTFDATGDGIQDVVIFDAQHKDYFAFIGKPDGTFEKAKVIIQDGIPFYQTEKVTYDSSGNHWLNDGSDIGLSKK